MNRYVALTVMLACGLSLDRPLLAQNGSEKESSLEKRAMAVTQRISASDLDGELPKVPFSDWFEKTVGSTAGVIWKLSECGERADASMPADDLRACAEVNATLADGRKVIAMITVGTFKKGITGAPAYSFGVIEHDEELYQVQRLRDLPKYIKDPGSILKGGAVKLVALEVPKMRLALSETRAARMPEIGEGGPVPPTTIDSPPPPEPKPRTIASAPRTGNAKPEASASTKPAIQMGAVAWGDAVTKVQPKYPINAKRVKASGTVDVQVTIAETGRVRDAKAINGHPLLRSAAEDAARQWVFKPGVLNGSSVETQIILTFAFNPPQ